MQGFRKTVNVISTVAVTLVILLAILLVGVKLLGVQVYTVLSGSMEPHFLTGSVIYVVDAKPETLEAGDVITFRLGGSTIATHRIVEVQGEGESLRFRTKGDNNDGEDANPVAAGDVIGKAVFSIPLLGYFITYIQLPPWRYIAIAAGAGLFLLMLLPDLLCDKEENKKKKGETEDEKP